MGKKGGGAVRVLGSFPLFACIGMCLEKQGATAARPNILAGLCFWEPGSQA